jgi:hypothetical protein
LANYQLVHGVLLTIETALVERVSKWAAIQGVVKKVNGALKDLVKHDIRVSFDPHPDDRFDGLYALTAKEPNMLSSDGRAVSLPKGRAAQHTPCVGAVARSAGVHVWRLHVHEVPCWLMLGILGGNHVPERKSQLDQQSFGWSPQEVFTAGKVDRTTMGGGKLAMKSGDVFELTLDCTKKTLTVSHNGKHHGGLSLPQSGPWRLHLNLNQAPVTVRML